MVVTAVRRIRWAQACRIVPTRHPSVYLFDRVAQGRLVPLLQDWCTAPKPLHIVYPPNRHLSNKVRVFVDWLAELFAQDWLDLSRGPQAKACAMAGPAELEVLDVRSA